MADDVIEVNTATLHSDMSSIFQDIEALKEGARSIRSAAADLGAAWEGPAKEEWERLTLHDVETLESLIDVIFSFTEKTKNSCGAYEQCENRVGQIIASIRI